MHTDHFQAMRRTDLQKLAKKNGIKANQKTETIIEQLTERSLQGSLDTVGRKSLRSSKLKITIPPRATPKSGANIPPIDSENIKGLKHGNDAPQCHHCRQQPGFLDSDGESMAVYPATPTYTLCTPESSLAGTPEPEAPPEVIEDVTRNMAFLVEKDKQMLAHIAKLRTVALKLRSNAENIRAAVRADRARRERIIAYLTYWRNMGFTWSYEDVWNGTIRTYVGPSGLDYGEISSGDEDYIIESERKYAEKHAKLPETSEKQPGVAITATEPSLPRLAPTTVDVLRHEEKRQETHNSKGPDVEPKLPSQEDENQVPSRISELGPTSSRPRKVVTKIPQVGINGGVVNVTADTISPERRSKRGNKRRREGAEHVEDEEPARSRPRLHTASKPPSKSVEETIAPSERSKDKGKRKMTPEEVEEMVREDEELKRQAGHELVLAILGH